MSIHLAKQTNKLTLMRCRFVSPAYGLQTSSHFTFTQKSLKVKEYLSWIFENDCSCDVEYSSFKGMKTSCKDLYLKGHRI